MKKLLAVLFAFALMVSLSAPSFALDDAKKDDTKTEKKDEKGAKKGTHKKGPHKGGDTDKKDK